MKRIVLLILLVCSMGSSFAQSPVLQLSQRLKSFSTYVAKFKQLTTSSQGRALQRSSGTITIQRPGKFRWESYKPTHQILITDGQTLWIYDVDLAQATKQLLSARTTIDPAMLLSGSVKNLTQSFNVNVVDGSTFVLTAKKPDLGFSTVKLSFKGNQLTQMAVQNNLSQLTTFSFSDIKLNTKLASSLFTFKAPKGVDVISQ